MESTENLPTNLSQQFDECFQLIRFDAMDIKNVHARWINGFTQVSEEPRSNVRYNFRCSYVADFAQRLIYLSPDVQSQTYVKNYPNITNIFSSKDILYFQQCIEKREIF